MSSPTVIDRRPYAGGPPDVQDLLVLWQHPLTREITPIGRFAHDGETYSFAYTRAAASIDGFRPLPGFADLRRRYTSIRIPAVFEQRVMEAGRPDYAEYLHAIGLDPAHATPWEQIVHSGGSRAGDTLQFMQVPRVEGGRARARFLVNGLRHIPRLERHVEGRVLDVTSRQQETALLELSPGDFVRLVGEVGNPADPRAVLATASGVPVGWVPRALSTSVRELMEGGSVKASVVRIGGPEVPAHLRLVLDLDVPAPPEFEFDREGRWEPLVGQ